MSYPSGRFKEVLSGLRGFGFIPTRLRYIHGNSSTEIFLVEMTKTRKCRELREDHFYIYNLEGMSSR